MGERIEKALSEYEKQFDDMFPTFAFINSDETEIIKTIESCISNKKDVYDSGFLELDNVQY